MNRADQVTKIIAEHLSVDAAKVTHGANLIDDLGADSLDAVEITMTLEEEFNLDISEETVQGLKTAGDIIEFIERECPPTD